MLSEDHYTVFEKQLKLKENTMLTEIVTLKSLNSLTKAVKVKKLNRPTYSTVRNPITHRYLNRMITTKKFQGGPNRVDSHKRKISHQKLKLILSQNSIIKFKPYLPSKKDTHLSKLNSYEEPTNRLLIEEKCKELSSARSNKRPLLAQNQHN